MRKLFSMLKLAAIAPFSALVRTSKGSHTEILSRGGGAYIFVITNDEEILKLRKGCNSAFVIDRSIFDFVKKYVEENRPYLNSLMICGALGAIKYWDGNHHDRIVRLLCKSIGQSYHISASL